MRGKFIVFEGGEGAGKSSTIAWLKGELPEGEFTFTREPGGTANAEEIREIIVAHRRDDLDPLTLILLFEAARREHMQSTILPALESGKHVICDRFSASTYAYQIVAGAGSVYRQFFLDSDSLVCGDTAPSHTILFDVEPEVGFLRKNNSGEHLNVFDEKDSAFHHAVRSGMKEYLKDKPHMVIDAGKSQQAVREEVKRIILSLMNHG